VIFRDTDRRRWAQPRQRIAAPPTWPFAALIALTMVAVASVGRWPLVRAYSQGQRLIAIGSVLVLCLAVAVFRGRQVAQHAALLVAIGANLALLLDAQSFAGAMLTNYSFVFCVIVASAAFSRAVATTYLIGTLAAVSVVMHFSQLQAPPLLWIVQLGAIAGTGIAVGYFIRWLKWYATTDDLTGVATRRAFDQVLDSYLKAARPGESPVSLAMIDLDDFKVVNDTEGHPAGDQLLRDVVDAWRRRLRTDDLIARLGGDEFALVLPNTNETSAGALVAELAVHSPCAWSVGVVEARAGDTVGTLVDRADAELFRDKRRHKVARTGGAAGLDPWEDAWPDA